jgi:putative phosphoesterase
VKIGILSDSHDNLPKIEKAVRFFNRNKVGFVLHAGDFVAPFTVPKLKNLNCDWVGVLGNNDGEKEGLIRISERKIKEGPLRLSLDNKKIVLVHDINKLDLKTEEAELIIFGHTHKSQATKQDGKFLINPGECGGWLTGKSTIAIVDLASLSNQILKI